MTTNLLTEEYKEELKKGLKLRSYVSLSRSIFILSILGLLMLLPAYILSEARISDIETQVRSINSIDDENEKRLLNLPTEMTEKLSVYRSLGTESFAELLAKVVDQKNTGVFIESIDYQKTGTLNTAVGTVITISGISATRQSLLDFSHTLENLKIFKSVDVPVSNLTREKNLPFTISLLIGN